ncbi:dip2 utp12 family protein [Cystoisospora suis]|uniref:Dip2 utp12 family protein n=1 Tax=Cystoisospora suis TaxID=483139 RepID=A0A2C6L379_9APIC|nr:dip2 utp12 family protein [Cystoisospora suis]
MPTSKVDSVSFSEVLTPCSLLPPPTGVSSFSPSGRLFATAVASSGDSDPNKRSRLPRSRVNVWEGSAGDEAGPGPAGPLERTQESLLHCCRHTVEWQRQFLGHSVTAVLFVPRSCSDSAPRLVVGTDHGLIACADVTSHNNKLLFSIQLDRHTAEETTKGEKNSTVPSDATSRVHSLACLDFNVFLALVADTGSSEGSLLYSVRLEGGSVISRDPLSKPYSLLVSRTLPSVASRAGEADQLVLLGLGHQEHESSGSSGTSANVLLYDAQQQRSRAKLSSGGGVGGAWTLCLEENLRYAAGVVGTSDREDGSQCQVIVWKLPDRRQSAVDDRGRIKKLYPSCSGGFFEPLVQILLPAGSREEKQRAGSDGEGEDVSDELSSGEVQPVIGLSRSNTIVVWDIVPGPQGREGRAPASFSMVLRMQIDTVSQAFLSPKLLEAAACSSASALVTAAATPGVWGICEQRNVTSTPSWDGRTQSKNDRSSRESSCEATGSSCLHLTVARGSHPSPLLQSLVLRPSLSSSCKQMFLPLLPYGGEWKTSNDQVEVEPLTLAEVRRKMGGKRMNGTAAGKEDDGQEASLPAASLKRTITATSAGGDEAGEVTEEERAKKVSVKSEDGDRRVGIETLGGSNVGLALRQALAASDVRLLESVLSSTAKDKKEVTAAVKSLAPGQALRLLQHLVEQQQLKPGASITKGGWIEEIVKQHAVTLAHTDAGREQLVLLLLQVEERRRAEAALVKVKGRLELLLQQMQEVQKATEEREKKEKEAREPLVVHRERSSA